MSKLVAIILAAGGSSRMGRAKALVPIEGVPLLARHVAALSAFELYVVVGFEAARHREILPPHIRVVENPSWRTDAMSDSLRRALAGISADAALVTPVDVPPADPGTSTALLEAGAPAIPVDPSGREGHPVLVDAAILSRLREAPVPGGLRTLLAGARRVPVVQWDAGLDFDDPASLAAWESARLTRTPRRDT